MEDREFRVKDVINLTLDRMKQEGIYFATKDDQGYASAKSLYKLDKEGYLEEKTIDKIVEEVISYMGDGAVYLVDAVNQWIEDGMAEGKLGYIDTLNMEFDDNEVIEGNLSIYNTLISHNLGTDIEPKEEEIAQEAEEVKPKKKKKTESKKVEAKVDGAVADIPDELLEPTPETKFTKKDWNIYYNRCKKDYTNVYNGDSTTKITFLQNKAKSLGLDDLQFTEDSWKSDIDNIAKAYADSKVGNLNEARTHMKLRKGDTFVNENGVRVTVIEVDDKGNTTYKFSNGESYCTAMENAVAMLNQNNYKKVEEKRTLRENKRQRLNEENSKSKDLINSMVTAKDFDSDSPAGQIILRTQELFNVLSDRGYDLQVTFDNGESQSAIMLGNQGGSILITITNTNQPLRAFTSGNFEITDDSLQILNDVKEQITAL